MKQHIPGKPGVHCLIVPLVLIAAYSITGITPAFAAESATTGTSISAQNLAQQSALPSLTGSDGGDTLAPPTGMLDINRAVQRAVRWHPDIGAEVGKLFAEAEKVNIAEAKYYPQVNGGFDSGITNSYSDHGYSPSLVLSLSQMLYDFGKVASSVREANAAVAQQQANVLVSIDMVAHDAAAALVQVQGYQQLVDISRQQLEALNHIAGLANMRNSEGASSRSDVVQTQTRIEGAQATLTQYQASLDRWRASLATWLGWQSVGDISNDFPSGLLNACQTDKVDDRLVPSVLAAWAQANQASAQLDNANAQMLPTISLEPEVTHYLNNRYANSRTLDRTQYSAWVRVKMPLYQGGGLSASRDAARHSLEAASAGVKSAQLKARQQLHEARDEATGLQQALQIQRRQRSLGEETRELYQMQYLELGSRPLLDVLNVEQEIYQTRFTLQQTETRLRTLQLDCLYNTGRMRTAFALDRHAIQGVELQP